MPLFPTRKMTELLNNSHVRENFDCGEAILTRYLKTQAGQDSKRRLAACFVLSDPDTKCVQGYYTLSSNSIPLTSFPEEIRMKLPKGYSAIPTTLIGRLAIDRRLQGTGMGRLLLMDALKRSYENAKEIGSFAVVVDPLDEKAERFYAKYDFIKLPDSGKMFLAMKTLDSLFQ